MNAQPSRTLLWFRRQLRVDDQPLFTGDDAPTIGVWALDPREWLADDALGFARCGSHRLRFLLESVDDLRQSMRSLGSDLIVRVGQPEKVLTELVEQMRIDRVRFVKEPGTQERTAERAVCRSLSAFKGVELDAIDPETLFEIEDVWSAARELPEVFSKWRRQSEKRLELGMPIARPETLEPIDDAVEPGQLPTLASLNRDEPVDDQRAVLRFTGGEAAAMDRIDAWMFEDDHLRRYKQTRNGLIGEAYSAKLSPWLALGCVSARRVAQRTLAYEAQRVANDSTYWLRFELMWRDYFRLYLLKHASKLFRIGGPRELAMDWSEDRDRFDAWRSGATGERLIDANMRELEQTGFMSNRGRQNVASYLSKNLGIDWRWGARWFESCLVDYDPAANWGNWAYAAGVGADPRGFRGFNVVSQADRYDPNGEYRELWLGPADSAKDRRPIVDAHRSLDEAERRWQSATSRGEVAS